MKVYPTRTGALCANSHPGSYTGQDAFNNMLPVIEREKNDESILCRERTTASDVHVGCDEHAGLYARSADNAHKMYCGGGTTLEDRKYVLRRLTPTECLRLMGLPDWWVDGANGSDSAIYKMCGNGLAIPCAYDVIRRIAEELSTNP